MEYLEGIGLEGDVYGEYLKQILSEIDTLDTLHRSTTHRNKYDLSGFNKKSVYLAQELKTRIASLPSPPTDKVRPVLRDIFF